MKNSFESVIEDSKRKVRILINKLLTELSNFLNDIKTQEERIEAIGDSIEELNKEIEKIKATHEWLNELKKRIEEE